MWTFFIWRHPPLDIQCKFRFPLFHWVAANIVWIRYLQSFEECSSAVFVANVLDPLAIIIVIVGVIFWRIKCNFVSRQRWCASFQKFQHSLHSLQVCFCAKERMDSRRDRPRHGLPVVTIICCDQNLSARRNSNTHTLLTGQHALRHFTTGAVLLSATRRGSMEHPTL